MRKKLSAIQGKRLAFKATVKRHGKKSSFKGPNLDTILLVDVIRNDTNEIVSEHLWFTVGKSWKDFSPGDVVYFEARVALYEKGIREEKKFMINL